MSHNPFAKRPASSTTQSNRRQSTRVDFIVPIVISGRDASSHPFRESTETFKVSFHGAALKTRVRILNGMHLTVENLMDGVAEEAICVRVVEPAPGEDQYVVAIHLLVPRNVWGLKNPPADWKSVSEDAPPTTPRHAAMSPEVTQDAAIDQRSADLAESVLQLLRRQAAGILRESLKEFEDRLKILESGAEARFIQQSERALDNAEAKVSGKVKNIVADAESSLAKMRRDLLDQLAARTDKALFPAEETLREKIAGALCPILESSPDAPPESRTVAEAKK